MSSNVWEGFLATLTGYERSEQWGIEKLIELSKLFHDNKDLLTPEQETLERTEFYIKPYKLRMEILYSCRQSAWHDPYDRNEEDVVWTHNRWVNGKLFTAVSRIVLCCGGRITYQN